MSSNSTAQQRHHGAFTLIELLVVISIISLMIAILLPVLSSAREAAQSAVCMSNQRQVGQCLSMYVADLDSLPPAETVNTSNAALRWNNTTWDARLFPYMIGMTWMSAIAADGATTYSPHRDISPDILVCPSDTVKRDGNRREGKRSYLANRGYLVGSPPYGVKRYSGVFTRAVGEAVGGNDSVFFTTSYWIHPFDIRYPASTIAIADGYRDTPTYVSTYQVVGQHFGAGIGRGELYFDVGSLGQYIYSRFSYAHNNATNFLFYDGHVVLSDGSDLTADDFVHFR